MSDSLNAKKRDLGWGRPLRAMVHAFSVVGISVWGNIEMLCRPAKQCEFLLVCLALFTAVAWAQPQLSYQRVSYGIDTFAGSRIVGDGGPALQAQLHAPHGVAVDDLGNLYIADRRNNRIRKVDSTGTITTVAGTGEQGFGGDGGPAVQAQLASPTGVAVDGSGNLYIADQRNNRIRKVDSTGMITTVAGMGEWGFRGDGGPAVQAQFRGPTSVAVDGSGNLYIADRVNHRIRKVDSTGTITTVAGREDEYFRGDGGPAVQAYLSYPWGCGGGLDGQHLHCRFQQPRHSQGRFCGDNHHRCGVGAGFGPRRGRRSGGAGPAP